MQTFGFDVRVWNLCVIAGISSSRSSSDNDNDGKEEDEVDLLCMKEIDANASMQIGSRDINRRKECIVLMAED